MGIHQKERGLMKAAAIVGPVSASTDAGHDRRCEGAVYYDPDCSSEDLDHSTLVGGYGFKVVR